MRTVITSIDPGSPAARSGVRVGEKLLSISAHPIADVLDYRFFGYDADPVLELASPDGTCRTLAVRKPEAQDLGLNFETYLMDEPRPCSNHCLFCFVDQMAPNCRETLYFKDDDARLSFLMGNYITLTNLSPREVQRIIDLRISPINVSVHATDPKVRRILLGNKSGAESLETMRRFGEAGIAMNGQIVLCPGYNDGAVLERTMEDMAAWGFASCSVVPVGLTRFREGLEPLEPFTGEEARQVLELIHGWQERLYPEHGLHFIHASDEWYILAGEELPEEESYDGYLQLENGVGMLRLLLNEFAEALDEEEGDREERRLSLATGLLAAPYLERMAEQLREKFPRTEVMVCSVKNEFFGEQITVSGLITGQDLVKQLSGRDLAERLLLPCNMLRAEEDVFLDDFTVSQVQSALQVPLNIVKSSGQDLLDAILGRTE